MARDSSGNYTLPPGNPVVTDTVIASPWANTTMGDLANEMTNSLSRTGQGGMLAPMFFADGAVTTPAIAFTNEVTLGLFREGSGILGVAVTGDEVARFNASNQLEVFRNAQWQAVLSGEITASDVINIPAGNIIATDVQAAIDELDVQDTALAAQILAVNDDLLGHENSLVAHTAENLVNAPAGNLNAVNVQAAINESDAQDDGLQSAIDVNTADIATNASDITTNADAIGVNAVNIQTNASDIAAMGDPIGVFQTWQLPSRVLATNYTNDTGAPIQVALTRQTHAGATALTCTFTVDGVIIADNRTAGIAQIDLRITGSFIIPVGSVYRADGAASISTWAELR